MGIMKGYNTATQEQRQKAMKAAWKWFCGDDGVVIMRDFVNRMRHYVWLNSEVRLSDDDIMDFVSERQNE